MLWEVPGSTGLYRGYRGYIPAIDCTIHPPDIQEDLMFFQVHYTRTVQRF